MEEKEKENKETFLTCLIAPIEANEYIREYINYVFKQDKALVLENRQVPGHMQDYQSYYIYFPTKYKGSESKFINSIACYLNSVLRMKYSRYSSETYTISEEDREYKILVTGVKKAEYTNL